MAEISWVKNNSRLILIILLGFALRLICIRSPLLDHLTWRQTDTAAIARNFYNNGFNIFYPQIDWGGAQGYVETEFPFYTFIVALLYKVFGIHDILGRLVSVVFSSLSIVFLFKLTRHLFNVQIAYYASLFFALSPLNIYYGRTFMPDTTMIFFTICSVYLYCRWLNTDKTLYLIMAALATSMAGLIKPSSLYIWLPLLYLTYQKHGLSLWKKPGIYIFLAISLLPIVLWYSHAFLIFRQYGNSFGIIAGGRPSKFGNWDIWSNPTFYRKILSRFIVLILTIPGTLFFLIGVLRHENCKEKLFLYVWAAAVLIYILIAARIVESHDYYLLPMIPLAAIFVGMGINHWLNQKWLGKIFPGYTVSPKLINILLLTVFLPFGLFRFAEFKNMYSINSSLALVAEKVRRTTEKDDLLIVGRCSESKIAGNDLNPGWPALLYHSNRKGWTIDKSGYFPQIIEMYRTQGAKYFITCQMETFNGSELATYLKIKYPVVDADNNYIIFALDRPLA